MGKSGNKGIISWPAKERPRELLLEKGPQGLSDAQLLAILLRIGKPEASAVDVAMDILSRLKGLRGLANRGRDELCTIPGVGPAKAAQILAAVELGKRALATPLSSGTRIQGSQDIFSHYYPLVRDLRHEVCKVILLDAKHRILRDTIVSEGSLTASIVHPREVFHEAVRESAAAIIVIHNHPSGDPTPSEEDHVLTQRLVAAGEVLGIQVLDHIIIGDGRYVSYADHRLLNAHEAQMPFEKKRRAKS